MIQEMQVCLVHGMKGGWASAYQVVPGIGSGELPGLCAMM